MLRLADGSTSTPAGTTVVNPGAAKPAGSWPYPNGDLANTRDAAGSVISSADVAGLQQAWTLKLPASLVTSGPGFGSLAATPVVTGAIVYQRKLPTSANAPIAIAGNTILVPAGGPNLYGPKGGSPQLVAYTVR